MNRYKTLVFVALGAVLVLQVVWIWHAAQLHLAIYATTEAAQRVDPHTFYGVGHAAGYLLHRIWWLVLATVFVCIGIVMVILYQFRVIDEQEQMKHLRNDFSYAMVHDMKSPLSSIIMGTHFLHSGKVEQRPDIKEKYFTIVEDEAEHLLALVNKLLTISKLENRKLMLNKWDLYLEPLVDDVAAKARAAATKPITITTDLRVKNVLADEEHLREALANLIDNAVKYSRDTIRIHISTADTDRYVLLRVRDEGIGIPKAELRVVFDKFVRAAVHEKNRRGGVSGFGLGLNYVDQVMRAHGGKVAVRSEEGAYTEFTLFIPKQK